LGRFSLIDINCGCPVRKITRRGAGVTLMKNPAKIGEIVETVSRAVSLPVSVKTRIGLSSNLQNISEVGRAVEEGGAEALFLHGRFANDRHRGPADWETIARIKEELSIPVIGNGGVGGAEEALSKLKDYHVDGVMIGRSAIGNPWIFAECLCRWTGRPFTPPSARERFEVITEHLKQLYQFMLAEARIRQRPSGRAEAAACRQFYGHLVHYLYGREGLGKLRKEIAHIDSIDQLLLEISNLLL